MSATNKMNDKEKCKIFIHGFDKKKGEKKGLYGFLCQFLIDKFNLPLKEVNFFWDAWVVHQRDINLPISKWRNPEYKLYFKEKNERLEIYLNQNLLTLSSINTMELVMEIFLSISFVREWYISHNIEGTYDDTLFFRENRILFFHDAFVSANACSCLLEASKELKEADLLPDDFDTSLMYYMLKNVDEMVLTCLPFLKKENALRFRRNACYCSLLLCAYLLALKREFPTHLNGERNDLESLLNHNKPLIKEIRFMMDFLEKKNFFPSDERIALKHDGLFKCFFEFYEIIYHPFIFLFFADKKSDKNDVETQGDKTEKDWMPDSLAYQPITLTQEEMEELKNHLEEQEKRRTGLRNEEKQTQ